MVEVVAMAVGTAMVNGTLKMIITSTNFSPRSLVLDTNNTNVVCL